MPIDPSIALQTRGISLPDPMAMQQQALTLQNLGMQNQQHQMAMRQSMRQDSANDALSRVLPEAIQGGFAPDVMQRLMQANPAAAPGLFKAQGDYQTSQQNAAKAQATIAKDEKIPLLLHIASKADYYADGIAKGAIPPAAGAEIFRDIQRNGLDKYMTLPSFQQWNDPAAVSQTLKGLGAMAYTINDRTRNVETNRHDLAGETETNRSHLVNEGYEGTKQAETASNDRARQFVDMMNARTHQGQLNVVQQRLGAETDTAQMSPEAVANAAARYNVDGTLPPMGMGRTASITRSAILNAAAQAAGEKSGTQQRVDQLGAKADAGAMTQLSKQQTMVGAFEKTFNANADMVLEYSKKVDRTGVPIVNKWIQAGKRAVTGDPELSGFDAIIKSTSNEFAKIVSGSMGNTPAAESEIKKTEALLNAAQTPEQVMEVIGVMRRETGNRMKGFADQGQELRTRMGGGGQQPARSAPIPNMPGFSIERVTQ